MIWSLALLSLSSELSSPLDRKPPANESGMSGLVKRLNLTSRM